MFLTHTLHQFFHVMSRDHQEFVHRVFHKGSGKYAAVPHSIHIDNQEFALWELPENLGFIKSIGSYKFEVTKKYLLLRDHIGWSGECNGARDFPYYPKYETEFIMNVFLEPEQAQTFLDMYEWKTKPYDHSLKILIELGWVCLIGDITKHTEDNPIKIKLTDKGRRECRYMHNTGNFFNTAEDLEFVRRETSLETLFNLSCEPVQIARVGSSISFLEDNELIEKDGDHKPTFAGRLVIHRALDSNNIYSQEIFNRGLELEIKAAKKPEPEVEDEIPSSEHRCTIKETHRDGVELAAPVSWCGRTISKTDWAFQDAQHLARAVGGSVQPCKKCVAAVIKELSKEL